MTARKSCLSTACLSAALLLLPCTADLSLGGTFTVDTRQPVHNTPWATPSAATPMMYPGRDGRVADLSKASTDVVRGLIEAFLNRQELQSGEVECLSSKTGSLTGEVMAVSSRMVLLLEQIMGKPARLPGMPSVFGAHAGSARPSADRADQRPASAGVELGAGGERQEIADLPTTAAESAPSAADATGLDLFFRGARRLQAAENDPAAAMGAPGLFLEFAVSAQQITHIARDTVHDCIHGDAREAFERAAKHMQSIRYVSGHVIANGADIVEELTNAAAAFRRHDHRQFGRDLGRALRKVVLSHSAGRGLPEGLPGKAVLANVSTGLLKGFFGEGAELDVRQSQDPTRVQIDLHKCVGDNLAFFQFVWAATMRFYAQQAARSAAAATDPPADMGEWGTALGLAMLELPTAMRRCDLSPEQEEMLEDSIRALGRGTRLRVELPNSSFSKSEVAAQMAHTVNDWSHMRWYTFGHDLGNMLQGMATTVYSQKYSVDSSGLLRKRLVELATQAQGATTGNDAVGLETSTPRIVASCSLAMVALLVVSLVLVGRRASARHGRLSAQDHDLEFAAEFVE